MKLLLSPEAVADIGEIDDYTTDHWGSEQSERYIRALQAACERLSGDPLLGRRRADVPAPYLVYQVASHIIVYRVNHDANSVEVLNILHPAMDVARRLEEALKRGG